MTRKISALSLFLFALFLIPRASFASSVTLTLESKGDVPYEFDVTSGKTTTELELSCLNDGRTVYQGESWTASATSLETIIAGANGVQSTKVGGTNGNMTVGNLEEDAYLDSQYDTKALTSTKNQEIQDAIWSVLDGYNVFTDLTTTAEDNAVKSYISQAQSSAASLVYGTKTASAFYSDFTFYVPTSWDGGTDSSRDIPQQFLGYAPPVTPEPSSLILLGTGLAGLAGSVRRRYKAIK